MTEQLPEDHPVVTSLKAVRGELKDALGKLRDSEQKLSVFEGIDPKKYREMETTIAESGKVLAEKDGAIAKASEQLQKLTKKSALAAALEDPTVKGKKGVLDLLLPHVLGDLAVGEDGSVQVVDKEGKPRLGKDSKPVTLAAHLAGLREGATGIFFDPIDTSSGGGRRAVSTGTVVNQADTSSMSPADRRTLAREQGQA